MEETGERTDIHKQVQAGFKEELPAMEEDFEGMKCQFS